MIEMSKAQAILVTIDLITHKVSLQLMHQKGQHLIKSTICEKGKGTDTDISHGYDETQPSKISKGIQMTNPCHYLERPVIFKAFS
jgi:hypothetical protein